TIGILAEEFSVDNKHMNPTGKIVRPKVTEYYEDLLKFLYTPASKSILNERNKEQMRKLLN
ncbi:MAG: hypothetical protein PF450_10595, partial [Bacteroidales bacterium]|nr:hypothetical protein [Bacteroidales bacterium]